MIPKITGKKKIKKSLEFTLHDGNCWQQTQWPHKTVLAIKARPPNGLGSHCDATKQPGRPTQGRHTNLAATMSQDDSGRWTYQRPPSSGSLLPKKNMYKESLHTWKKNVKLFFTNVLCFKMSFVVYFEKCSGRGHI